MSHLRVRPITLPQANLLVARWHRHHTPLKFHRFSMGAELGGKFVGAVIVGPPVSRMVDRNRVAEVSRLVTDGTKNACSILYAAAARAAQAMGYDKIQTYILESEPGTSLRASGWSLEETVQGKSWDRPERPRDDKHPTDNKQRWSKVLNEESPCEVLPAIQWRKA